MPLSSTYTTGTITVAANGTTVTGARTNWLAGGVRPGDILAVRGLTVTIREVTSATTLALATTWPGTALSASPYEIRYTPDATRVLASSREAIAALESARSDIYISANVYASPAAGLAATTPGQQFQTISVNGENVVRYRHDPGGVATEVARYPTASAMTAAVAQATSAAATAADGVRAQVKTDADRAAAAAEMTTATAASLGSVAALSPYMMATVRQMDGTLPARPPAPFVFWQGWSNPGVEGANLMAPGDIWCRENAPTVPVSPNPADWSVYTLRDEPGIIIRRKPFPSQRPPLTGFEVSLDGGPSQIFTETEHRITGLTVGQAYVVVGFLRNYLGQGLPSEPEEVTVQSGPFMDDFTRPNQPLAQSPFWVDLRIGPSGSRRVQVVNNRVTLASTNDFLAARAGAYLNPRQYAQAKVLNSSTNTSEPRGVHLLLRTPEFVDAIISLNPPDGYSFNVTDYNWEIRENTAGASRVLASGGNPTVWPAVVRFEADGNALRGFINGVLVGSASDDKHPRGFAGLALNASGSEGATSVELDDFECGNLI